MFIYIKVYLLSQIRKLHGLLFFHSVSLVDDQITVSLIASSRRFILIEKLQQATYLGMHVLQRYATRGKRFEPCGCLPSTALLAARREEAGY